ncbi:hypothetical protein D8674_014526 [Pyrus ussuriensis x Pyrus communis]|uniref:Dynein light chain n=1 Tax=Pyrus ussuriensis x Pyrus communis TaxID=2448454 RepID=A0A5N5GU26_9ROSA|nr:hypothetical protein D8674_014526 [Pyrus ussuriensis x Pyrus communis]
MASSTPSHEKQKRGGAMSTYKYNPSSGRHLKPESKPVTTMADKTHALRNWFNLSMRKPKPRPETDVLHCDEKRKQGGNETYSLDGNFGNGRRGGGGGGGGGEVLGSRKSVSHVETNLASVASFLQVKVLVSDMPGFMQVHAFRSARRTYDSLEKFSSRHMAYNLKKEFDKLYGPAWHCIVGSGFGSFVTHSTGCFLYFSMEKLCILLFRTKIQKAVD